MNLRLSAGLAGAFTLFAAAVIPITAIACSSCGCSVATDWSGAGYANSSGLRVDARFDFIDQNQLRLGSHVFDKNPEELPTEHEYQQGSLSRFYTLGLDYSINRDWGINVQVPYLVREHQTIGEEQDTADISRSETQGIGDVRLIARWQGLFGDRSWGLQFGLKLPTGSHHKTFTDGALAADGEIIDRGLQNGTGTTDLILGVYNYAAISRDWDRFEQLQLKQALDKADGFRPSSQFTASAGLRYVGFGRVTPQLQLNARVEGKEVGSNADYDNSGSQAVYVSPGLSGTLAGTLNAYGFVQLPVYQHYTGYQLAPHYLATVGLSYGF
ncbi:hypothetical protein [Nevskia ramosa]|uniref:hypothetical protein n=1 Tax=Nevskia ramosa TaxID=64002 RepID=UPI003D0F6534